MFLDCYRTLRSCWQIFFFWVSHLGFFCQENCFYFLLKYYGLLCTWFACWLVGGEMSRGNDRLFFCWLIVLWINLYNVDFCYILLVISLLLMLVCFLLGKSLLLKKFVYFSSFVDGNVELIWINGCWYNNWDLSANLLSKLLSIEVLLKKKLFSRHNKVEIEFFLGEF